MKLLVLATIAAVVAAKPQGYNIGAPSQPFSPSTGGSFSNSGAGTGGGFGVDFSSGVDLRSDGSQQHGGGFFSGASGGHQGNGGFQSGGSFSSGASGGHQGGFQSGALGGSYQAPSGAGTLQSGGAETLQSGGAGTLLSGGAGTLQSGGAGTRQSGCAEDEVLQVDGSCARPVINRRIFVYAAPPAQEVETLAPRVLPQPKVDYNLVFVRTKQRVGGAKPIVVPPPQQKTVVYVLNEKTGALEQEVIEVPSTPTEPEVFFVNYEQGDNPQLPGGIDLSEALAQSTQQGEVIDGASAGGDQGQIRDDGVPVFTGGAQGAGSGLDGQPGFGVSGGSGEIGGGAGTGISSDYSAPGQRPPQPPSAAYSAP